MDCTELQRIFAGELEGDLEGSEDRAFTDHLSKCGACRDVLAQAEGQLAPLVTLFEPPPLPEAAWERVTLAVRDEARQAPIVPLRRPRRRSPFPVFVAAAAAVLFLAGVVFLDQVSNATLEPGGSATSSHLELSRGADAEPTLVEAGPGYEAGTERRGQLLCLWVRETP